MTDMKGTNTMTPAATTIAQIGQGNLLAISGGRIRYGAGDEIILPVGYGYWVEIDLDKVTDTYTVRRVFTRGLKRWVKAEWNGVYADRLGDIAYEASCFLD
jgi:hypothetical protein